MKNQIKNLEASIRARLNKIARDSSRDFDAVLLQYFQERFLYRLSISAYKLNFILKGALLFIAYEIPRSRPTKDIDFLGINTSSTHADILRVVKEVVVLSGEDGIRFDPESITSEVIKKDTDYQGIRINIKAYLGRANRRIHFDIGFGDKIIPNPVELDFPVLLPDMPYPRLIAYTPESAIAEKLEAIVKLGLATSRMKDFYDIYHLASHRNFDASILREAIETTFNNRKTSLSKRFEIYKDNFINEKNKQLQWNAFLHRHGLKSDLSFPECVRFIEKFIEPLFERNNLQKKWNYDLQIWN